MVLRRDPAGPPQGTEDVAGGAGREGRCEAKLHRPHREGRGGYAALLADPHRRSIETEFTTAITYWLGYDKTGDSKGDRPEDGRRGRTYVQHFAGSVHGRKQSRHRGMDTRDVTPKLYLQGSHVWRVRPGDGTHPSGGRAVPPSCFVFIVAKVTTPKDRNATKRSGGNGWHRCSRG